MNKRVALIIMFFILGIVLIFHFLILTEQIPYDRVWAGKIHTAEEMKSLEIFSILLNTVILAVLYTKYRQLSRGVNHKVVDILIWMCAVFFLLNTVANLFSKNTIELVLGTLLTLTSAILCFVIVRKNRTRKVIEEKVGLTEHQQDLLTNIDFVDTFATKNQINNIEEITDLVFNTTPRWVKSLFVLRNKISGFFGLKTEMPSDHNESFKVGGYVKFFKIFAISDTEVILGADDSHLNFRALICNDHSSSYNIKVITLVEYNNLKGKLYMTIIKPFHRKIVKRMVQNAFREK